MSIEAVILLFALTQIFELFVLFALAVLLVLTVRLFPLPADRTGRRRRQWDRALEEANTTPYS
jgi:hypothetical protein